MKTIFTFLLVLATTFGVAQNSMFVHTATVANSSFNVTYIDHPDLNANPNANLVVSHNWNPVGSSGVYNNNVTGVWYDTFTQQWAIYNENPGVNIVPDSSYNVYYSTNTATITHIATVGNQGAIDSYTVLNSPLLNGNPNAHAVLTTYYNPNNQYNDTVYGFWYDDTLDRWIIYSEDGSTIPLGSAFFVAVNGADVQTMRHVAIPSNIFGNYTIIDHPVLNGDPNAVFVFGHNWGISGDPSNVIMDHNMGVWYDGANWSIYTEDFSAVPENATFDLLIYDETLGVTENNIEGLSYGPNPVKDILDIRANNPITSVTIYNILGQKLTKVSGDGNAIGINLSGYASGSYFATVIAGDASETIKLIKQ